MHKPQETLSRAIDRASEITWWNRQMTKLTDIEGVENPIEFTEEELVEQRGPYVELVNAPKTQSSSAAQFLRELGYDEAIVKTVAAELFGDDRTGSLYQHQAETIKAIEQTDTDTILSVPTATGKTEAFFFPILNHCLSTDEDGLKSLIIYPMKTLSVDQLNRFITYLDRINQNRRPEEQITIGIWDGDTPHDTGSRDYEIESGSFIRGLECPRTGDKLRILSSSTVGTDEHTYSWIKVTRESIQQGADILLTNPEALDYMFVNNSVETRDILGLRPGQHPVKHIVYDEAHVWSGISGAAISLLTRRLKHFFGDRDPQVTMVSATVSNPAELASSLTGSDPDDVSAIGFESRDIPVTSEPTFTRFEPCRVEDVYEVVGRLLTTSDTGANVRADPSLAGTVTTLSELGVVTTGGELQIADNISAWLAPPVESEVDRLLDERSLDDPAAVFADQDAVESLVEAVVSDPEIKDKWYNFVVERVPEVAALAEWFETDTTGSVGFKRYTALLQRLEDNGVENAEGVLTAMMTFGRLAGIITEKYHAFLKPPAQVYWCRECRRIARSNACPSCGNQLPELRFCTRCHTPYVEREESARAHGGDNPLENDEQADEREQFVPVGHREPVETCPGCGKYVSLTDIEVPTSTLLSFMLTEICRTAPSKKTLVFSDSHAAAESVGSEIIETEYGLMAESLYIKELLDAGGVVDNYDAFQSVSKQLREAYYEPLFQNEIDEDSETFNILRQLRSEITGHAMLRNCRHLTTSALVTPETLFQGAADDTRKLVVGHVLYTLLVTESGSSFDMETVSIQGLTADKMAARLANKLIYDESVIKEYIPELLDNFLEEGIVVERAWESLRADITEASVSGERADIVFDYVEKQRAWANRTLAHDDQFESGVFTRNPKQDQSQLRLVPRVTYCRSCYSAHPVPDGHTLGTCPSCGEHADTYDRFERTPDGSYGGSGYADVDSEWNWPLDHWGHEVVRPLQHGEPEHITVGIHKGNIPPTLRGAIEESFRKDDPNVNVVSATPTMELGVDIGSLETVTQVGIPPTLTNYVQRSGRTGRTSGSSSLVMTVMRGRHPVDNHYFANLDGFFREFEDVRVPDPYEFDELVAGHVVTATMSYLARNPHNQNVFEKIYELPEEYTDLQKYVSEVERRLAILQDFIDDARRSELKDHIRSLFGQDGVDVFERVFDGSRTVSLDHRVELTFSQLADIEGSSETNKRLTERHNRLDSWLSLLGYLANYRDFGQRFPVKFSGRRDDIEFESSGRLYDMFPGEANDLGSVMRLHGSQYAVCDVHGTNMPLTTVRLCDNDECSRPFQSYPEKLDCCPHCGEQLVETDIHGIGSVECRTTRGGEQGYNTRGIMSTHISPAGTSLEASTEDMFDLSVTVERGEFVITDFVYAFERGHSQSPDRETLRSEALIEGTDDQGDSDDISWRDVNDVTEETYAPIGQRYHTRGMKLTLDRESVASRLGESSTDGDTWPQVLASLEQAVTKSVTVVADCDQQDFRVKTTVTPDTLELYVVDGRQGGNGITWQVLQEQPTFVTTIEDVASCDRCADYCEECLLLSRTPPAYLENDLLNKYVLRDAIAATH